MSEGSASPFKRPSAILLALALACYALTLLLLRPASPFEWDEILFQRALDRYDVGAHWPHPPGYPVYVGLGKAAKLVVGDNLLALQLVGVLAATASLLLLFVLARRLGAGLGAASAAVVVVAVTPAFAFHANVGYSDVAGAAGGVAAVLALVVAADRPALLSVAAALTAVAVGIRPQLVVVLVPVALSTLYRVVRARAWRHVAAAFLAGAVTSVACWLPAALVTGPQRFLEALAATQRWMSHVESNVRLPGAPLGIVLQHWLIRPFGPPEMAYAFWLLAIVGAVGWWRAGRRNLVWVGAAGPIVFLAVAIWSMNYNTGPRYILAALPFLALLLGGACAYRNTIARYTATGLLAAWVVSVTTWGLPVYVLRLEPAPVFEAVSWIRQHADPKRNPIAFDGIFSPHLEYTLSRSGFAIVKLARERIDVHELSKRGDVLIVTPRRVAGAIMLFEKQWTLARLRWLTRNRYHACFVSRPPAVDTSTYSAAFERGGERWTLEGTGTIELGTDEEPRLARIGGGDAPLMVRSAGRLERLPAGEHRRILVYPGPAGEVAVTPEGKGRVRLDAVQLEPVDVRNLPAGVSSAYMVPALASVSGLERAKWRSDLTLFNPQAHELPVVLHYLPTKRDNRGAVSWTVRLEPQQLLVLTDVLGGRQFGGLERVGALLARVDRDQVSCKGTGCDFLLFARTRNTNAGFAEHCIGEGLPGIAVEDAVRAGQKVRFAGVSNDHAWRGSLGVASWTSAPVTVSYLLRDAAGREVAAGTVEVQPFGHRQATLSGRVSNGTLEVAPASAGAAARVFPYVALVSRALVAPTHILAAEREGAAIAVDRPPVPLPGPPR